MLEGKGLCLLKIEGMRVVECGGGRRVSGYCSEEKRKGGACYGGYR